MMDIVIKWKWIKRELILILSLYIIANLGNIISIIIYQTSWSELFTSQLFVLYITEWIYILSIFVRLIYFGIRFLLKKIGSDKS